MAGIIQTTWAKILDKLKLNKRINTIDEQIEKTFEEKMFIDPQVLSSSAGSSNEVTIYEVTDNADNKKKVAVRLAKNPTFYTEKKKVHLEQLKKNPDLFLAKHLIIVLLKKNKRIRKKIGK